MMLEGHRNMQLTYNNIEYAVVLDGCLTVYLLNNGFVLRGLGETHTQCAEKGQFFNVNPAVHKVTNQHQKS